MNRILKEIAFVELDIQLILSQQSQYFFQVLYMLLLILWIYQCVINKECHKLIQVRVQRIIHQTHEGGCSIGKTKRNHHKLIMPIPCTECSLIDVFFFNACLMISWSQMNIEKHYNSLHLIKQIINLWQWIPFIDSHLFQRPIVCCCALLYKLLAAHNAQEQWILKPFPKPQKLSEFNQSLYIA